MSNREVLIKTIVDKGQKAYREEPLDRNSLSRFAEWLELTRGQWGNDVFFEAIGDIIRCFKEYELAPEVVSHALEWIGEHAWQSDYVKQVIPILKLALESDSYTIREGGAIGASCLEDASLLGSLDQARRKETDEYTRLEIEEAIDYLESVGH